MFDKATHKINFQNVQEDLNKARKTLECLPNSVEESFPVLLEDVTVQRNLAEHVEL